MKTASQILNQLAEPFDPAEIKWKPAVVSGNRAMALAYVDARVIQDRLDDVLGVEGWQDDYECKEGGSVVCRLRIKIGDEWIVKVDVGSPSEQPDDGDKLKAAFSDALKRAAVKFGVGRFLYRLPQQWVDYDPKARKFASLPKLPAGLYQKQTPQSPQPTTERPKPKPAQPSKGEECMLTVNRLDREWSEQGHFQPGHLIADIKKAAEKAGWPGNCAQWTEEQIKQVGNWLRTIKASQQKPKGPPVTGGELLERIRDYQKEFKAVTAHDAFLAGITKAGREAKFPPDLLLWSAAEVKVGYGWLEQLREDVLKQIEDAKSAMA